MERQCVVDGLLGCMPILKQKLSLYKPGSYSLVSLVFAVAIGLPAFLKIICLSPVM